MPTSPQPQPSPATAAPSPLPRVARRYLSGRTRRRPRCWVFPLDRQPKRLLHLLAILTQEPPR